MQRLALASLFVLSSPALACGNGMLEGEAAGFPTALVVLVVAGGLIGVAFFGLITFFGAIVFGIASFLLRGQMP